ncbi:hypothetical protein ACF1DV_25680 [Streptomyces achromogenes]|uniref:hypothetical protein n=1 Tax=Streptomyces achromogenes TaxID=67255 RepID=UPI003701EDF6
MSSEDKVSDSDLAKLVVSLGAMSKAYHSASSDEDRDFINHLTVPLASKLKKIAQSDDEEEAEEDSAES